MRRIRLTFEEMVERNKRELQFDEEILDRVEKRLLERHKKDKK